MDDMQVILFYILDMIYIVDIFSEFCDLAIKIEFKVLIDDEIEEIEAIDELQNELPELQPRFVIYSCR